MYGIQRIYKGTAQEVQMQRTWEWNTKEIERKHTGMERATVMGYKWNSKEIL